MKPRNLQILLVEDNPIDARVTRDVIQEKSPGNNLVHLEDGVEAMAYLQREGRFVEAPRPDIILLDLNLPKKDGRDVLASITRSQGTRSGKLNELLATLELTKYDRLFYLGDPIDFVGIKYDEGIDFIEVKTGRARFTEDELKLKDLIECKMVNYLPLTVKRINFAEEINREEMG